MRKLINGLYYDTLKSRSVAENKSYTLYITQKRNWFMANKIKITPLDALKALEWMEINDIDHEIIKQHFTLEEA